MPHSILYVDNEPLLPESVESCLHQAGYSVHHDGSGIAGLQSARQRHPDVIVLDVRVDDVSSFEVRRTLSGDPALMHTPVIILSSDALGAAVALPFDPAANVFLSKPFEPGELIAVINRAVGKSA